MCVSGLKICTCASTRGRLARFPSSQPASEQLLLPLLVRAIHRPCQEAGNSICNVKSEVRPGCDGSLHCGVASNAKRLLNAAEIARDTGFSTYTVNAVKKQRRVPSPFCGKYTTREKFETWMLENPWFRAADYYRGLATQKAELAKLAALRAS